MRISMSCATTQRMFMWIPKANRKSHSLSSSSRGPRARTQRHHRCHKCVSETRSDRRTRKGVDLGGKAVFGEVLEQLWVKQFQALIHQLGIR